MKVSDVKEIQPNENTRILGLDDCLGSFTIKQLADLICSMCGWQDNSILLKFSGIGKCPEQGKIFAYHLTSQTSGYTPSNIEKLSISNTDVNGIDLINFITTALSLGSTFTLTNTADPTNQVLFSVSEPPILCAVDNSYIVGVTALQNVGDLLLDETYKLSP